MSNVIQMKGIREVPRSNKSVKSMMDTLLLTQEGVTAWKIPPFQRPLRVNEKVREMIGELKENGGVISGVITLGILNREKYLVDGQHRIEAFKLSELEEGYADVRICHFDSMAEMGREFVKLNSALVRMRPDDLLRGLEGSHEGMALLRKKCPFIGYDNIRRRENSPIVGMSAALRAWFGSVPDVPKSGGPPTQELAARLTNDEASTLSSFLNLIYSSWGKDEEYYRLWSSLNLTITAWLYRRTVISLYTPSTTRLTTDQFAKCLMAVSASTKYLDWMVGRQLTDRDRSPCYGRLKIIFTDRLRLDTGKNIRLPSPPWDHGSGGAKIRRSV